MLVNEICMPRAIWAVWEGSVLFALLVCEVRFGAPASASGNFHSQACFFCNHTEHLCTLSARRRYKAFF